VFCSCPRCCTPSMCAGAPALATFKQAVLVLRWFLEDTRMSALARDNAIAVSAAYEYRDEGIAVLAAPRPSLHGALLAAKAVGHSHVIVDGTLIHTDRISTPGPTRGVDLWWSGKHHHHGGNIQVVSAPDGWPLWTSDVRPGREHHMSAARADPDLLARIADWISDSAPALADLGYERATRASPRPSRSRSRSPEPGTCPTTSRPDSRHPRHTQADTAASAGSGTSGSPANSRYARTVR
jgi:hypothetical protein